MHPDPDTADRLRGAFPLGAQADVERVLDRLPASRHPASTDDIGEVAVVGERVRIPYRICVRRRGLFGAAGLDDRQRRILACIETRHDDGYVRAAAVAALMPLREAFEVPFVVQLVGEYVVEIVQSIHAHLDELDTPEVRAFVVENAAFVARTRRRATSYWACYHRWRWPRMAEYPGLVVLDALERHAR